MPRKPRKGYFVRGQFVAEGSELDQQLKAERAAEGSSKSELKRESEQLQKLGADLLTLRTDALDALPLPDKLATALADLRRITDFEGRRRQLQYVGKLMRTLDDDALAAARSALEAQRSGSARETLALHEAERWRERLVEDDRAVTEWLARFPDSDAQQLRALVRQARKDSPAPDADAVSRGLAPRQGRAFRELFQLVRARLAQDGAASCADGAHDPEEATDDE